MYFTGLSLPTNKYHLKKIRVVYWTGIVSWSNQRVYSGERESSNFARQQKQRQCKTISQLRRLKKTSELLKEYDIIKDRLSIGILEIATENPIGSNKDTHCLWCFSQWKQFSITKWLLTCECIYSTQLPWRERVVKFCQTTKAAAVQDYKSTASFEEDLWITKRIWYYQGSTFNWYFGNRYRKSYREQ